LTGPCRSPNVRTDAPVHRGNAAPRWGRSITARVLSPSPPPAALWISLSSRHRLLRRLLGAVALLVSFTVVAPAPAGAADRVSDAQLLASIKAQARHTTELTRVLASHDGAHLAILTRSYAAGEPDSHDELWLADADGSQLTPVEVAFEPSSASAYSSIGTVLWSANDTVLAYQYSNTAVKSARHVELLWFAADRSFDRQNVGDFTETPSFTRDGRYLTFRKPLGFSPPSGTAHGAVDLASRAVLARARVDYPVIAGVPPQRTEFAPECARSQEADWEPALATGPWLEQALSSPDPGCRFGANVNDPVATPTPSPTVTPAPSPTPTPTPDPAKADDAPANITRPAPGTGLVPIAERPQVLGPTVRVRSSAKGLSRAMRRGLRVKLDLAGATTLKAYLIVARPSNEGLFSFGPGSTTFTIGRLSLKNPPSQTQTIAIPFTKDAREVLPRFLKITVTVRLVATDRAGNRTVVERQVALTDF
jgi:hypothetical protein